MQKNTYVVKNKVTGFEFNLTKEDCDKLVIEEPFNFEVIDKDYVYPVSEDTAETTTYDKVVEIDEPTTDKQEETTLDKKTVAELIEICEEKKILVPKKAKKVDLIALIEDAASKETVTEETKTETTEETIVSSVIEDEPVSEDTAENKEAK